MVGWDGFILSTDVVTALENHRLIDAAHDDPQVACTQVQQVFEQWHEETRLAVRPLVTNSVCIPLDARLAWLHATEWSIKTTEKLLVTIKYFIERCI